MRVTRIVLSFFFVLFSFSPTLIEWSQRLLIPDNRAFVFHHHYLFDYNFYLSRIREGYEGRFLVVEKYYNHPHQSSLLHGGYLLLGRVGAALHVSPETIYHGARLVFGFLLLSCVARYIQTLFKKSWMILAFLFVVTAGSWPIVTKVGEQFRFATFMGWWSVIDSLQRITFVPHILVGQLCILLIIWRFSHPFILSTWKGIGNLFFWVGVAMIGGLIFPPAVAVFGVSLILLTLFEGRFARLHLLPRFFLAFAVTLSLVYLHLIVKTPPWDALPRFDIEHRITLPYGEYALALGPMLPLGLLGMMLALARREQKLFPIVSWIAGIGVLFLAFEFVPQQSPSRFTQAAIHIPLGILAAYSMERLWQNRRMRILIVLFSSSVILLGFLVMVSQLLWLTDQVQWKKEATWEVPLGAQIAYPVKEFMDAVYVLRDQTDRRSVVLSYVTAGNFIPAYAGNFVYIGHANTPGEDQKEKITARFFAGTMSESEAQKFLTDERISFVFFGPQEREFTKQGKLLYTFLTPIYENSKVTLYLVHHP